MKHNTRGFTLVELNLAMVFVSILAIAIAVISLQASQIYQKGMTLKKVNQVGREVIDQVRRDIAAANINDVKFATVSDPSGAVINGRLCLGQVAYVYNSAKTLRTSPALLRQINYNNSSDQPVGLVRVEGAFSKLWCEQNPSGQYDTLQIGTATASMMPYRNMMQDEGDISLAVHSMRLDELLTTKTTKNSGLYRLTLRLGTNQAATIDDTDGACKPPSSAEANFDYCSVRDFDTIIRTSAVNGGTS